MTVLASRGGNVFEAASAGGATILATRVGDAAGSAPAAAALACAGAEPDRAGLLVDLRGGREPRPTLIASTAARKLEERLAAHLPEAGVASRGQICHLSLLPDLSGVEQVAGVLAVARGSVCVLHLPPRLLQPALEESGIRPLSALLRADLDQNRALTALAAGALRERGVGVGVLKRPLGWVASRRALAGILPPGAASGLPPRLISLLLREEGASHECYSRGDGTEADTARAAQPEWRDHARARPGRGLHRHSQRDTSR